MGLTFLCNMSVMTLTEAEFANYGLQGAYTPAILIKQLFYHIRIVYNFRFVFYFD